MLTALNLRGPVSSIWGNYFGSTRITGKIFCLDYAFGYFKFTVLWDPPAIATHNARRRLPAFPGIGGQGGILAATVAAGKPLPPTDSTIFPQMRDEPLFFEQRSSDNKKAKNAHLAFDPVRPSWLIILRSTL